MWRTTKRVDKFTLITMIAAFTWRYYCTCRNNEATICQRKIICDFLLRCLKNDTCNSFQGRFKKNILCWLIFNKPLPNLYSRDRSIQGTPSSVLRVSPELQRFHCSDGSISTNNWWMHFSALKFQNFLGEHAPKKRPPWKGVLMGPSLIQLIIVSILTSWLLETSDFR